MTYVRRALDEHELKELNINEELIERIKDMQYKPKNRQTKHIVLLTKEEAETLSKQLKRDVVKFHKWGDRRRRTNGE